MGILTPNSAVSSLLLLSLFSPWRVEIGIGLWGVGGKDRHPKMSIDHKFKCKLTIYTFQKRLIR